MKRAIPWSLCLLGVVAATNAFAHGSEDAASSESTAYGEQLEFGRVGKTSEAKQKVVLVMGNHFAFEPSTLKVKFGKTLHLVFRNTGMIVHEWILGTPDEIAEHAELMRRFPNMEHDEPHQVHVPPGKQRELVWQFNRPGRFEFACLQPGHYEAGMKGFVEVK